MRIDVGSIIDPIVGLVDELFTSNDEKAKAKLALMQAKAEFQVAISGMQRDIIVAEAQGKRWLQNNWRPALMAIFGLIVANNYILAPYLGAMFGTNVVLDLPPDMWALLKIGVGGYIVGRSAEKGLSIWKNGDKT